MPRTRKKATGKKYCRSCRKWVTSKHKCPYSKNKMRR